MAHITAKLLKIKDKVWKLAREKGHVIYPRDIVGGDCLQWGLPHQDFSVGPDHSRELKESRTIVERHMYSMWLVISDDIQIIVKA